MSDFIPVVIIGAPRSGTNMLRDVLTALPDVGTWPCDEINYIWRHGNVAFPTDELGAQQAKPAIKQYIRRQFLAIAKQQQVKWVVEKTCASCLRIPFIDAILPDAYYIYIYRDGIDAAGSAQLRWSAKLDLPYLLKKVRYVPFLDLPYYGLRYLWARLYRLFSKEKRLAFWGPSFTGLDQQLKQHSLNEICALQWQACVQQSEAAFLAINPARIHRIKYEDFVSAPQQELKKLTDFLKITVDDNVLGNLVADVSSGSIGKGRQALGAKEVKNLELLVADMLKKYGY